MGIWITADGRSVAVKNMTDGHLLNTLALLMRKCGDAKRVMGVTYVLSYERTFHIFEQGPPVVRELVQEAEKRGLDWDISRRWQPPVHLLLTDDIPADALPEHDMMIDLPADKPGVSREERPSCLVPPE